MQVEKIKEPIERHSDSRERYIYAYSVDYNSDGNPKTFIEGEEKTHLPSFAEVTIASHNRKGLFCRAEFETTEVTGVVDHARHISINVNERIFSGLVKAPFYQERVDFAHWRVRRRILGSEALKAAISSGQSPEAPNHTPATLRPDAIA